MKILITNDDSVSAGLLLPLIRWCRKLGEVEVYVPKVEQSAKSHGIEIRKPFEVTTVELEPGCIVHTVDSTPADCVRYAIMGDGFKPDLVISGINKGYNVGKDIMYSGTCAAIFEAVAQGVPGIALSTSPDYYEHGIEHLDRVHEFFLRHDLMGKHMLYNVNIPPEAGEIRITHQGGPFYSDNFRKLDNNLIQPQGRWVFVPSGDLTLDTDAITSGYISISPLTINRTDMDMFRQLSCLNP